MRCMVAKTPLIYRRLPGRGTRVMTYYQMFLGADHLLQVCSTGFTETYRRFYFRDIQAVLIQRTPRFGVLNGVFGGLLALSLLGLILGRATGSFVDGDVLIILGVLVAIFLLLPLLINLALGPTCVCRVRTSVQMQELPSLARVWKAQRVWARVRTAIQEAQSGVEGRAVAAATAGLGSDLPAPPVIVRTDVLTQTSVSAAAPASESSPPIEPPLSPG